MHPVRLRPLRVASKDALPVVVSGLALASAVGLLLGVLSHGLGITPDSVVYLQGARSLAHGAGFTTVVGDKPVPITHFPPGYSAVLAAFGIVGRGTVFRVAYLNVALRLTLLVTVWIGLRRIVGIGNVPTAVALVILAVAPDVTYIYTHVWSEPLFLVLSVAGLFLLTAYLDDGNIVTLAVASLLLAAATLTRFVGLSLLALAPLLLLARHDAPWRTRLVSIAVFTVGAAFPVLLWAVHHGTVPPSLQDWGAGAVPRAWAIHLPTTHDWALGAQTLSLWFFPYFVPPALGISALAAIEGLIFAFVLRARARPEDGPARSAVLCARVFLAAAVSYLALVVVARSLADALVPFDRRLLSAAFIYVVVGTAAALDPLTRRKPHLQKAALLATVLVVAFLLRHACAELRQGIYRGYAEDEFARTASEIAPLQSRVAYSNDPDFLRYYFDSDVRALPARYDPFSRIEHPGVALRLQRLCSVLESGHQTVFFSKRQSPSATWNPTLAELTGIGRLRVGAHGDGWMILEPGRCQ